MTYDVVALKHIFRILIEEIKNYLLIKSYCYAHTLKANEVSSAIQFFLDCGHCETESLLEVNSTERVIVKLVTSILLRVLSELSVNGTSSVRTSGPMTRRDVAKTCPILATGAVQSQL